MQKLESHRRPLTPEEEQLVRAKHLRTGCAPKEAIERGFNKSAVAWRLLLQLASEDTPELDWGDWGRLYFLCREEDIAERRFERCCVIVQWT